jgi:hypothetical protein
MKDIDTKGMKLHKMLSIYVLVVELRIGIPAKTGG